MRFVFAIWPSRWPARKAFVSPVSASVTVESFLKLHNVELNTAAAVLKIVTTMGFKEEVEGSGNEQPISPEFAVVQDADRLDAIGAIGIARAFTYRGSKKRKMYDHVQAPRTNLTKGDYTDSAHVQPTTINHFVEKLLKLKDLMKSQKLALHFCL